MSVPVSFRQKVYLKGIISSRDLFQPIEHENLKDFNAFPSMLLSILGYDSSSQIQTKTVDMFSWFLDAVGLRISVDGNHVGRV